jgi:uncharacterized SAM-binding protein YcdF (DUF218 family)
MGSRPRRPRHPGLLVLLLLVVLVVGPLAASAIAVWRAAHTDEASRVDSADVVLILGAAQYGGRPSPVFRARLDHGRLLYERGFAPQIMVLGAGQEGDLVTEAEAGVQYLQETGVSPEAISASPHGTTTLESLRAAADLMRERDLNRAFLVSDPWHNLRIRRMARDLGIEAFVSATFRSAATSQGTRLQGYTRETFAYLYYRVFGR